MITPNHLLAKVDTWQRKHRVTAISYGVMKKFGDDNANQLVVALGWYGFVAIYPLLLVVVTIFGFIGAASLGYQLVTTLHQFPVVGSQFNPAHGSSNLHGSVLGLTIGLVGLVYGAQGVTQTVQQAMASASGLTGAHCFGASFAGCGSTESGDPPTAGGDLLAVPVLDFTPDA